jgi:hypothetical protein
MTKFNISVYNSNKEVKFLEILSSGNSVTITTTWSLEDLKFNKCSVNWTDGNYRDSEATKEFACALAYAARVAEMPPEDFIKKLEYLEANKITTVEYSLT